VPVARNAPLIGRESLGGAYRVLTFRHPEVARDARPGQFVMIKAGRSAEPPLRRPFSIMATDAEAESFSLFIKVVGQGTAALDALPVGGEAQCLGPLGRPFPAPDAARQPLLVAGGYGVAPFLMLCGRLGDAAHRARVFYGGRSAADLPLTARFDPDLLVAATEDGSLGERGLVTEPLERHLERVPEAELFACGPEPMLHAVARIGARRGLPTWVSLDPWMGCGFGTCLGCVVMTQTPEDPKPRHRCACTEGPVFDASDVVWPGEVRSRAAERAGETA
jgi:dihydroorotate dehydrogenase electron transfer subunit